MVLLREIPGLPACLVGGLFAGVFPYFLNLDCELLKTRANNTFLYQYIANLASTSPIFNPTKKLLINYCVVRCNMLRMKYILLPLLSLCIILCIIFAGFPSFAKTCPMNSGMQMS